MELLPDDLALALLAWEACGQNSLPANLIDVAKEAVRACGGLPLAVKVLGGALCQDPATPGAWKVTHLSVGESMQGSAVVPRLRLLPGCL